MDLRERPSALHEGENYPSPFSRLLALGYYDGATDGFLVDEAAGQAFRFEMLDGDEDDRRRVFRLAPVPVEAVTRLMEQLACFEPPRQPYWVPGWRAEMEGPVRSALERTGQPAWLVAAEDLLGVIAAARPYNAEAMDGESDWFAALGLARQHTEAG